MTAAHAFPDYEVPPFVLDRFPGFRPADPQTWPEPERCTEGRPWGLNAYGPGWGSPERQWRTWLDGPRPRACRYLWKHEDTRLCGTHENVYRKRVADQQRTAARRDRQLEHVDLARQLSVYGIEATGYPDAVRLQADAVRDLLRILAEADRLAPL